MEDTNYYSQPEDVFQQLPTEETVLTVFWKCIVDVVQNSEGPLRNSQVITKLIEGKKSGIYHFLDSTEINIQTSPALSRLFNQKKLDREGTINKYEYFMPGTKIKTTKKKRKRKKKKSLSYYILKILRESEYYMKSGDVIKEIKNGSYPDLNLARVSSSLGSLYERGIIKRTGENRSYKYYIKESSEEEDEIIPMRDIDDIIEEDHGIPLTPMPAQPSQDATNFNEDLEELQNDTDAIRKENELVSKVVEELQPKDLQVAQEGIQKLQKMLEVQTKKTEEFSDNCDEWKQKYSDLKEKFEKANSNQQRQLLELRETVRILEEKARENHQNLVNIREERVRLEKVAKENSEKLKSIEEERDGLKKRIERFDMMKDVIQVERVQVENENSQLRTENVGLIHENDNQKVSLTEKEREIDNLRKLNEDLRNQQQQKPPQPIQLGKRNVDTFEDIDDNQLPGVLLKRRKIANCENLLVEKMKQVERDGELESVMRSPEIQSLCGEEEANRVVIMLREYRDQVDPVNTKIIQGLKPVLENIQNYTNQNVCDTCECYSEYFITFPCGHTETNICLDRCFGILCKEQGDVWCTTCGRGVYGNNNEQN